MTTTTVAAVVRRALDTAVTLTTQPKLEHVNKAGCYFWTKTAGKRGTLNTMADLLRHYAGEFKIASDGKLSTEDDVARWWFPRKDEINAVLAAVLDIAPGAKLPDGKHTVKAAFVVQARVVSSGAGDSLVCVYPESRADLDKYKTQDVKALPAHVVETRTLPDKHRVAVIVTDQNTEWVLDATCAGFGVMEHKDVDSVPSPCILREKSELKYLVLDKTCVAQQGHKWAEEVIKESTKKLKKHNGGSGKEDMPVSLHFQRDLLHDLLEIFVTKV